MSKLIGTIKLQKFSKHGVLLETRVQPMRSWTRGLMDILYTQASQIVISAPALGNGDINTIPRYLFAKSLSPTANMSRGASPMGHIISGGGGSSNSTYINDQSASQAFADGMFDTSNHLVGIQVGADPTAPTPTDKRLVQRFGHGILPADGGEVTYLAYDVNDDSDDNISANNTLQLAQMFIPTRDFRCSSVDVKVWKNGAPAAALTVEIRGFFNLHHAGAPQFRAPINTFLAQTTIAAAAIGASPGAFVNAAFGTPVDLYAGQRYFINLWSAGSSGGNSYYWRRDSAGATAAAAAIGYDNSPNIYFSGYTQYNVLTGNAWANSATIVDDALYMFRLKGRSNGELEYGGNDLGNRISVNPNDQFDIKRYFYNRTGGKVVVQEVGIHALALGTTVAGDYSMEVPVLIARDAIGAGGVTVADDETLLVTYTPAIVV